MKKLIITTIIVCAMCGCTKKTELHVFNWSDYISPDVIQKFESENNCKVIIDSFDSNEAMYAKLRAGATAGYDLLFPTSYQVELLAKEGMILELDKSQLPNVITNFDHSYDQQILDTNFTYSVPYVVTYTGFMYLTNKIDKTDNVNSWTILENAKFKGKITLLDDIREVIGAGLMANGFSINSTNQVEIDKAVQTVLKWKSNVRKFDAESYKNEVAAEMTYIGHGYSSDSAQTIFGEDDDSRRDDIAFAYPREGFCVAFDEMCILKTSKNIDLAYKFIDFLYQTENAKDNIEYVMGIMPQKYAIEQLDEDYKKIMIPDDNIMKSGQLLKGFTDNPEIQEMYNAAWDKIKSTKNK